MSGRHTSIADRTLARGGRWTASVTVLLVGAGVAPFVVLGRGDRLWDAWIVHNALFGILLAIVLWLTAPVEPRNPVMWIIALATAVSGIQVLTAGATVWLLESAGISVSPAEVAPAALDPPIAILQWLSAWTWVLIAVPLGTFLPLLFPDGHLPDRRWRLVLTASLAVVWLAVASAQPSSAAPGRFNRSRYDAQRVVDRFGARLRADLDIDRLAGDLGQVVGATVQPTHVRLWTPGDPS